MKTIPAPTPKPGAWSSEMTLAIFCGYSIHELAGLAIESGFEWSVAVAYPSLAALGIAYLFTRTKAKGGGLPSVVINNPSVGLDPEPEPPKPAPTSGRASLAGVGGIAAALLAGFAMVACASLLEPVDGAPEIHPAPVEIPLGGEDAPQGSVLISAPEDAGPRPMTKADAIVDAVELVGGGATGNPWLFALGGQIAHALIGAAVRRKK